MGVLSVVSLFVIGYGLPFVVVFRGGSLGATVKYFWLLLIVYSMFLCLAVPEIAEAFFPGSRDEFVKSVPEARLIVGMMGGGWMMPLIGGEMAYLFRGILLGLFPKWMAGVTTRGALGNVPEFDSTKDPIVSK